MQQLFITLVALLGMIVPVANSRMTKLFKRVVPLMPVAGRVAAKTSVAQDSAAVVESRPAGFVQALLIAVQPGLRQPTRSRPDPQQRRMRRAQRATGWRCALSDQIQALASCKGFFFALNPH